MAPMIPRFVPLFVKRKSNIKAFRSIIITLSELYNAQNLYFNIARSNKVAILLKHKQKLACFTKANNKGNCGN